MSPIFDLAVLLGGASGFFDLHNFKLLFFDMFKGRPDVVAERWEYTDSSGNKQAGYRPVCTNRKQAVCPKTQDRKAKCGERCPAVAYVGLNDALLEQHLAGDRLLGFYPLLADGTCHLVAGDFDNHDGTRDPYQDILAVVGQLQGLGLHPYVLRSKSGAGYHLYTFFDYALPAWKARVVMFHALQAAGVPANGEGSSFDRFFPNQDSLPAGKIGNLIALPFQGKSMPAGNTLFLDPATDYAKPHADQVEVLQTISRASEADLDKVIAQNGLVQASQKALQPGGALAPAVTSNILHGGRNTALTSLAGTMHARGMDREAIRVALQQQNLTACSPPLEQGEVDNIVDGVTSAYAPGSIAPAPKGKQKLKSVVAQQAVDPEIVNGGRDCTAPMVERILVHTTLPGAPCTDAAVIPGGYMLTMDAGVQIIYISRIGTETQTICSVPLLILERHHDIGSGYERIKLAWFRDGSWKDTAVDRKTIADPRDFITLANLGLPITAMETQDNIKYLAEYEQENLVNIPLIKATAKLGWQPGGKQFMLGRETIQAATVGQEVPLEVIHFRGQDKGDEQIADGFHVEGDYGAWARAINGLYAFSRLMFMFFCSMATPFLEVFKVSNFVVDLAGETSKGKTISLRVAASAWGNPDERTQNSALYTWDQTQVWLERTAGLLNGIPLILDDTKRAKNEEVIGDIIYIHTSGKGRGRGSLQGTREIGSWRSVLLSSGEQSAVDYSKKHGGTRARAISIWGAPFGDIVDGEFVKGLNAVVLQNYGHAGQRVVQFILDHREDWPVWREAYRELSSFYSQKAGSNTVADRLSDVFALLGVVVPLIHAALPELVPSRPIPEILEDIWGSVIGGAAEADRAKVALSRLWDWAVENQSKFWGRHKTDSQSQPMEPHSGWAGRWDRGKDWKYVAFTRRTMEDLISSFGFDWSGTLETWKRDRGWLELDKQGRNQRQTQISGALVYCYRIPRNVIQDVLELNLGLLEEQDPPF